MGLKAKIVVVTLGIGVPLFSLFVFRPYTVPSGSMQPTFVTGDRTVASMLAFGLRVPGGTSWLARWATPQPDDVVVFVAPRWAGYGAGEHWMQRAIAVGGQRVSMRSAQFFVDGKARVQVAQDGSSAVDADGVVIGDRVTYAEVDGDGRVVEEVAIRKRETLLDDAGAVLSEHGVYNDIRPRMAEWPIAGAAPRLNGLRCSDDECVVVDGYVFVAGDNRDRSSDSRMWGGVPVDNVIARVVW